MLDDEQLKEIETFARGISQTAGAIVLDGFEKPMRVEYKSENQIDPVTDVDKRSEAYLREAIVKEFPGHAILAEEGSQVEPQGSEYTWVIDPLDGTTNFINGLPFFGVSVALLERGRPLVGSIFVPSVINASGKVFHARRDGGAFCDETPIEISQDHGPKKGGLTIFPSSLFRSSRLEKNFRKSVGEIRGLGSVAYELALTASGAIQYSLFGSPWVWDVAAGVLLVTEANGTALVQEKGQSHWTVFHGFTTDGGVSMTLDELKECRSAWLCGNREVTSQLISHMVPRNRLERGFVGWLGRWIS